MSLASYVTLGRSGLRVSPMCLGAMTFGQDLGWGASPEDSCRIIDAFVDRGGNFIDTANVYTYGHSEAILGEHVGHRSSKRNRLVLATKFFGNLVPGDPNAGGASRKNIFGSLHESLRRLQTDYVDLYWMHAWDKHTPIDETLRALDDLVTAGKVRYVGFSDTPAWKCAQAQTIATLRGWAPLVALQIEHSLLERTVEGELLPMARELGLGVTPWGPLKGGALSGKYTRENAGQQRADRGASVNASLNERTYAIVDELGRIARELATTPARVALAWVASRPGVTSTIIGARTLEQLDQNLGALEVTLRPDDVAKLDAISKPTLPFPVAFLDRAGSFMHPDMTVNGESAKASPVTPKPDTKTY